MKARRRYYKGPVPAAYRPPGQTLPNALHLFYLSSGSLAGSPGINALSWYVPNFPKNVLPPMVIKVADTVRITGNNAVHPGEMSDDDFDYVASKMFGLLNFVVVKAVNEPRELEVLYKMTPEAPRKDAEARDANARRSKATGGEQGEKGPSK